jgi:hypothetical protein
MNNSFAINIQSAEAFLVYYLWEVVLFFPGQDTNENTKKETKINLKCLPL